MALMEVDGSQLLMVCLPSTRAGVTCVKDVKRTTTQQVRQHLLIGGRPCKVALHVMKAVIVVAVWSTEARGQ